MKILICNAGSTSLKFKLYEMPQAVVLATGKVERVGSRDDAIFAYQNCLKGTSVKQEQACVPDYRVGIQMFIQHLTCGADAALSDISQVERVGYKATLSKGYLGVHEITDEVLEGMRQWLPLARLHNTAYLQTMAIMRELLPMAVFVGAFETSFHRDIPLARRLYGLPYEWYEKYGVQRLGYHSASHSYIADVLNEKRTHYRAISCHLGGSCSVCAIRDGKSIDTSFGMSLQSGVVHAARVGDMDGDMILFLKSVGLSEEEIIDGMQNKGGLLGISGISGDMRYIEAAAQQGNERAQLALELFASSVAHYIGAFYVNLGGLDDLVFTGGVGENSDVLRRMVCQKLAALGVSLDEERNLTVKNGCISAPGSKANVWVLPTDEELGIARSTYAFQK